MEARDGQGIPDPLVKLQQKDSNPYFRFPFNGLNQYLSIEAGGVFSHSHVSCILVLTDLEFVEVLDASQVGTTQPSCDN
jgi:hypothetical protein